MSNILSIKDENGNGVGIDAIQGERGPQGPAGPKQKTTTITLPSSGWTTLPNGKFKKVVSVPGITASDSPVLDVELSSTNDDLAAQQVTEWAKAERADSGSNQIEFRFTAVPEIDLKIIVKGF